MKNVKLEICVGTLDDINALKEYDVDRIEVTSALELGGLTPTLGMIHTIREMVDTELACMVRPHANTFVYSLEDVACMFRDAKALCEIGVDGIVFGFLNENKTINTDLTKKMVSLIHSYHKQAIFHKAFDYTVDIFESFNQLQELQVDRVLTEGGFSFDVKTKRSNIKKLVSQSISTEVLVGGGVRSDNVLDIIKQTNCNQVHSSCKSVKEVDGVSLVYVDKQKVKEMVETLNKN